MQITTELPHFVYSNLMKINRQMYFNNHYLFLNRVAG